MSKLEKLKTSISLKRDTKFSTVRAGANKESFTKRVRIQDEILDIDDI